MRVKPRREHRLEQSQFLPYPRGRVFPFFSDASNLERITPEFLHFRILTPLPMEMRPGAILDYRIRLFGIPMNWRTRIESFDAPVRFTDTQEKGPYALWHHTHEFHEVPGGTLMVDRVRYALPLGVLGSAAHVLFVRGTLKRIFSHRRDVLDALLREALGAPAGTARGSAS